MPALFIPLLGVIRDIVYVDWIYCFLVQDVDAVDMCLRAINALASYLYREKTAGSEGLASLMVYSNGSNGRLQGNISSHFLRSLLQLFFCEDFRFVTSKMTMKILSVLILCLYFIFSSHANTFTKIIGAIMLSVKSLCIWTVHNCCDVFYELYFEHEFLQSLAKAICMVSFLFLLDKFGLQDKHLMVGFYI